MYKIYDNYSLSMSDYDIVKNTLENILQFFSSLAYNDSLSLYKPSYVYAVQDGSQYCVQGFKISDISLSGCPVIIVKYAWAPTPLLIFATDKIIYKRCEEYDIYDGINELSTSIPHICIAFSTDDFSTDTGNRSYYSDFILYSKIDSNGSVCNLDENIHYSSVTTHSMPFMCYSLGNLVGRDRVFSVSRDHAVDGNAPIRYRLVLSTESFVFSMLFFYDTDGLPSDSRHVFIASSQAYKTPDCDIDSDWLCCGGEVAYLIDRKIYVFSKVDEDDNLVHIPFFDLVAFNTTVDHNISCTLLFDENNANIYNYRNNVSAFRTHDANIHYNKYLKRFIGNTDIIRSISVPYIQPSFNPYELSYSGIMKLPSLVNNYSGIFGISGSNAYIPWYPYITQNTLNNHASALPFVLYVRREPLSTRTWSVFIGLDFLVVTNDMYSNDANLWVKIIDGRYFLFFRNPYNFFAIIVHKIRDNKERW